MPVDFTPQSTPVSAPTQAPQARLPHISNAPFYLMYHPLRWIWDAESDEFLPNLGKMVIEPGVGAVDKSGDSALAETIRAKKGWVILPWSLVPAGTPGGSYLKSYAARGPAGSDQYHCEIWETPRQLAGRVMTSVIDTEGRKRWLRWLMAEGHIPAISSEAREYLTGQKVAELARLEGKTAAAPERVAALQEQLTAMTAPTPAKGKGRRPPEVPA